MMGMPLWMPCSAMGDTEAAVKIIECVPNFSEGRSPEKVREIAAAAASVPGVTLLDYSWDGDHNRSVVTFLGTPEASI